ncbi:MAG TPA: hypothetical protein VFV32_06030 [Acidimicrobiales bacterium]|jgi:hypothetical protein|nr:hypothetical protein [Acidimicrobiales bacterium]
MSRRHHDLQPARSARQVAKMEKRKARHKVALALHQAEDPDDLVVIDPKPERIPRDEAPPRRNRMRHWKVKAWKRRTAERHRRNEELTQLRESA